MSYKAAIQVILVSEIVGKFCRGPKIPSYATARMSFSYK